MSGINLKNKLLLLCGHTTYWNQHEQTVFICSSRLDVQIITLIAYQMGAQVTHLSEQHEEEDETLEWTDVGDITVVTTIAKVDYNQLKGKNNTNEVNQHH
jgi:hypothetical protein